MAYSGASNVVIETTHRPLGKCTCGHHAQMCYCQEFFFIYLTYFRDRSNQLVIRGEGSDPLTRGARAIEEAFEPTFNTGSEGAQPPGVVASAVAEV